MKNYHTHTRRCQHAIDSEEDYILSAIQSGYTELGFSDHTPWIYDSSFHPMMRREAYEIDDYVSTLLKSTFSSTQRRRLEVSFPIKMPTCFSTNKGSSIRT